jgi:anti-sigma regulatory factor (Ser/Thr protein kinase)
MVDERTDLECGLEECEIGGLGIHITKHFMDDISYQRSGNKNVVTLKINLRET